MEAVEPLLASLTTITWLLAVIAAGIVLITIIFMVLAYNLLRGMKENRHSNRLQAQEDELDSLLASDQGQAAKAVAQEWLSDQPARPEALWALARAHYQLGELSEARQVLDRILEVAPEDFYRVDAWLERLEDTFASKRPRSVE